MKHSLRHLLEDGHSGFVPLENAESGDNDEDSGGEMEICDDEDEISDDEDDLIQGNTTKV